MDVPKATFFATRCTVLLESIESDRKVAFSFPLAKCSARRLLSFLPFQGRGRESEAKYGKQRSFGRSCLC